MHLLLRKGMRIFAVAAAFALVLGAAAVAGVKVSGTFSSSDPLVIQAGNTGAFQVCATVNKAKKCLEGENQELLKLILVAEFKKDGNPLVNVTPTEECKKFVQAKAAAQVGTGAAVQAQVAASAKVSLFMAKNDGSLKATLQAKASQNASFGGTAQAVGDEQIVVLLDLAAPKEDQEIELELCVAQKLD